jgi:hypothetical protein
MICDFGTELFDASGNKWTCTIVDMSGNGFGIITDAKLMKGDMVSIVDPMTKARVVWIDKDRAGLMECKQEMKY